MDKKELQNLIDRISLTGPEGIKKIKKVLKELNDVSSSSMGEDEEYTIAQALNDLNEKIEKQVIHYKIYIERYDNPTLEDRKKIGERVHDGTILDCIIVVDAIETRVLSVWPEDESVAVYHAPSGNIIDIPFLDEDGN